MFEITDQQKVGIFLSGFGMTFLFLGVLMVFDRGLLAIGNILFISGLTCIIGFRRTYNFFFQRHKMKATVAFFLGIFLVLIKFPLIGLCVEMYGFVLLFGGFLPATLEFLRRIPVIGSFLNLPIISGLVSRIEDKRTRDNYA